MKLLFGNIVVGARGRIGGQVLSANASGPYAKAFRKGVRRGTQSQESSFINQVETIVPFVLKG